MSEEIETVYSDGASVFFFCDVTPNSVRDLCHTLKKVSREHLLVRVYIKSDGGDMFSGFAAFDFMSHLKSQGVQIETIALGLVASAAVDILLAGSKRLMGKNAYVLVHQISSEISGSYDEMKQAMKHHKWYMKRTKKILEETTQLGTKIEEYLTGLDKKLSARKCLKYGIIDEII
jgi:ATP-dependent protease ClpP protease subunit